MRLADNPELVVALNKALADSETDYKNDTAQFLEDFDRYITHVFGERNHGGDGNNNFDPDCQCCLMWRHFDQIKDIVDFE